MKIDVPICRDWIPSDVGVSTHFFLEGIALEDWDLVVGVINRIFINGSTIVDYYVL